MRLRPVIKKYQEAGNSEKSHKEGPTGGGRIPYGLASGNKKNTVAISAIISAISEK